MYFKIKIKFPNFASFFTFSNVVYGKFFYLVMVLVSGIIIGHNITCKNVKISSLHEGMGNNFQFFAKSVKKFLERFPMYMPCCVSQSISSP